MSEWQPIETAPIGQAVQLGWYDNNFGYTESGLTWRTAVGLAWVYKRNLFISRVVRGGYDRATHWRPLPEPPQHS